MGFSRKTDNYNLPLWDGGDKFTITGDLNHAHEIVDSTLKNNEDISTRASNLAADASARVNDVSKSVDTRVTVLESSVDSKIETAKNDINSSVSTSLSNQNNSINTTVTGLKTSVDGDIKSLRDDMAKAVAGVPAKYLVDIVGEYGADPTGTTDTTPIFAKINTDNPNGCCIFFRPGTYLFNDMIQIVGNTRLVGSGAIRTSTSGHAEWESGGTFLDFRVPGGRRQCISFDAHGTCSIEHLTIGTKGDSATTTFINDSVKVLIIDDVSFSGPPEVINDNCTQDAIVLGSSGNNFAAYGTRINNVTFSRIRTCITLGPACNGILVSNIVIAETCGSSLTDIGAIHLDGGADQCTANWIMNVVAEPHAYSYLVSLGNTKNNRFDNLQAWDTGWMNPKLFKQVILFYPNAKGNIFNETWLDGMSWDKMSSDNLHLAKYNTCNQGSRRSLQFMTAQDREATKTQVPPGSLCLAEEDGRPYFNTGKDWISITFG